MIYVKLTTGKVITISGAPYPVPIPGPQGLSAYQVAIQEGFVGTQAEWVASLEGPEGKSAYEVAVASGFIGTQAEWVASLKGDQGDTMIPHTAYASDANGTGFTYNTASNLAYQATTFTNSEAQPAVGAFAGKWHKVQGPQGLNGVGVPVDPIAAPNSGNAANSGDLYNTKQIANGAVSKTNLNGLTKIKDAGDSFYFTDIDGNIMFIVSPNGGAAVSFNIIDPVSKEVIGTLNKDWLLSLSEGNFLENIRMSYKLDGFYFTDSVGNVMAKIDETGVQSIAYKDKNGDPIGTQKKLKDKLVISLGDSHARAAWLPKFCELTGAISNDEIEEYLFNHQADYPDTAIMLGQARALKQYCIDNGMIPNLILIENCHFSVSQGKTLTDYVPQIYDNLQVYPTTYASFSAFVASIGADKAAFIAGLTPTLRTALRFNYSTYKETLTFTSAGTLSAGTIVLTIDGANFPITIQAGSTLSQAVTLLNDWAFDEYVNNWTNAATKGSTRTNTIELIYTGSITPPTRPVISFNGGSTGMVYSGGAQTGVVSYIDYFYNAFSLDGWTTDANWLGTNGNGAYSSMMAVLEFLQDAFPLVEIIVWGVQFLNVSQTPTDANSYLVQTSAGSGVYRLNIQAYYNDVAVNRYLESKSAMKEVAERYNCRFIDVDTLCGITIHNMFDGYYGPNNLHPFLLGYEKWGEVLANEY